MADLSSSYKQLAGTEAQIQFAESIRAKLIRDAQSSIAEKAAYAEKYNKTAQFTPTLALAERGLKILAGQDKAAYFIAHKNDTADDTLNRLIALVQKRDAEKAAAQ